MTTVLLFHHAQGQTRGLLDFAEAIRAAGHEVHAPDLYDGDTFETLEQGVAHAKRMGFDEFLERGLATAKALPEDIVYAGVSLGVMPAQSLAQNRAGARGALFYSACLPPSEFGGDWPETVPLQIHMMADDPTADEDLPAARELVLGSDVAELFLYPGSGHLFVDASLGDYDEAAAREVMRRTLAFLDLLGSAETHSEG